MWSQMNHMLKNWNARLREPSNASPGEMEHQAQIELLCNFLMSNTMATRGGSNFDSSCSTSTTNNTDGVELLRQLLLPEMVISVLGPKAEALAKILYNKTEGLFTMRQLLLPQRVLSIVGPGADVLADDVYGKIKGMFMCNAVIKMSTNMNTTLESILRKLGIEPLKPGDNDDDAMKQTQKLISKISKFLRFKRYLVIIHDIWEESEWTILKDAFPRDTCFSSRVITTTRRNSVAQTCSSSETDLVYKLEQKGGAQKYEAAAEVMRGSSNLEADDVAMSGSGTARSWTDCFLYLSTVPDDQKFERNSLVSKWVAQGFVDDKRVANVFFDELVNRNVIQTDLATRHGYILGDDPIYHVHHDILKVLRDESRRRGFVVDGCRPGASVQVCEERELVLLCDDSPAPADTARTDLDKVKVAGRCVKLPVAWIKQLSQVTVLDIRVCHLNHKDGGDLQELGKMESLRSLSLSLVSLPKKQIIISAGSATTSTSTTTEQLFLNLEVFSLDCRVPWLAFQEKAMPKLQLLCLKLYSAKARDGKIPSGINHLQRLREVILHYSPCYADAFVASPSSATVAAVG